MAENTAEQLDQKPELSPEEQAKIAVELQKQFNETLKKQGPNIAGTVEKGIEDLIKDSASEIDLQPANDNEAPDSNVIDLPQERASRGALPAQAGPTQTGGQTDNVIPFERPADDEPAVRGSEEPSGSRREDILEDVEENVNAPEETDVETPKGGEGYDPSRSGGFEQKPDKIYDRGEQAEPPKSNPPSPKAEKLVKKESPTETAEEIPEPVSTPDGAAPGEPEQGLPGENIPGTTGQEKRSPGGGIARADIGDVPPEKIEGESPAQEEPELEQTPEQEKQRASALAQTKQQEKQKQKIEDTAKQKEEKPKPGELKDIGSFIIIFAWRDVLFWITMVFAIIPIIGAIVPAFVNGIFIILAVIPFVWRQDKLTFWPFITKFIAEGNVWYLLFFLATHSGFLIYLAGRYKLQQNTTKGGFSGRFAKRIDAKLGNK